MATLGKYLFFGKNSDKSLGHYVFMAPVMVLKDMACALWPYPSAGKMRRAPNTSPTECVKYYSEEHDQVENFNAGVVWSIW